HGCAPRLGAVSGALLHGCAPRLGAEHRSGSHRFPPSRHDPREAALSGSGRSWVRGSALNGSDVSKAKEVWHGGATRARRQRHDRASLEHIETAITGSFGTVTTTNGDTGARSH